MYNKVNQVGERLLPLKINAYTIVKKKKKCWSEQRRKKCPEDDEMILNDYIHQSSFPQSKTVVPRQRWHCDTPHLLGNIWQCLRDTSRQGCCSVSYSVQLLSCVQLFAVPGSAACRPTCPSPTPTVYSNSCPLSRWCHPTISSSVIPFSSRL